MSGAHPPQDSNKAVIGRNSSCDERLLAHYCSFVIRTPLRLASLPVGSKCVDGFCFGGFWPRVERLKVVQLLYLFDAARSPKLLPWDDPEEFAALHNALKQEFFPIGPSEEECVLDLTQLFWTKRTIWRFRTATVRRDRFTDEIVATGKNLGQEFAEGYARRRGRRVASSRPWKHR